MTKINPGYDVLWPLNWTLCDVTAADSESEPPDRLSVGTSGPGQSGRVRPPRAAAVRHSRVQAGFSASDGSGRVPLLVKAALADKDALQTQIADLMSSLT